MNELQYLDCTRAEFRRYAAAEQWSPAVIELFLQPGAKVTKYVQCGPRMLKVTDW